jgi:hypothetical protein
VNTRLTRCDLFLWRSVASSASRFRGRPGRCPQAHRV